MGDKKDTVDDFLDREFKQWEKTHIKMKDSPPPDGHDYLKHANNLLALLEATGVSDLHPIAKLVIVSFKAAVRFEQDRRENDARVTAVFLAQTDVMRVLLDVDNLANRRRRRSNAEVLRSDTTLNDILLAIQKEIKSCGNSIDTYYKESRFVKFWKSQDWKSRMLGHIRQFNKFRLELQQTLSIQVASGVEDLVFKMDTVLSRFFTPKNNWEKDLEVKTRGLGNPSSWIQNTDTLQSLIMDTNDPALPLPLPTYEQSSSGMSMTFGAEMQLSNVKKELQLSVEDLCEKNMDMFELKLNFHTQQMEKAIADSANLVIQSLSGPCDRVINEDLRQLWKEMDWIFCVENKFFISALFEFYLDRFSTNRNIPVLNKEQNDSTGKTQQLGYDVTTLQKMFSLSVSAPKFSFLSRLGSIHDPDSWTLEYIALHGHHITQAIDNDGSGFIRISEANAFTQQIPKGWNLPQWCAYSAAGWAYEARIYRRRINRIWSMLTDMQAKVLSSNRGYLYAFSIANFLTITHAFTREPTGQHLPNVTPELRELVKEKVLAQDALFREHLRSLKWTIEDESTLHLLYDESPPEKYILQLCTLMMERFLEVAFACRTVTIDIKEWLRMASGFRILREITVKRVSELGARFEDPKEAAEYISSYRGGIWSYVKHKIDLTEGDYEMFVTYSRQELAESLLDVSIVDDFLVPWSSAVPQFLQYTPWEEFVKTLDECEIPSLIPRTWDPLDNTLFQRTIDRSTFAKFPMTEWICDHCDVEQKQALRYRCLSPECPDLDFCKECHELPEADHNVAEHTFYHPVAIISLIYVPELEQRIALEVESIIAQLHQEFNAQQRSNATVDVAQIPPKEKKDASIPDEIALEQRTSAQKDGTPEKQEVPVILPGENSQAVIPVNEEKSDATNNHPGIGDAAAGDVDRTQGGLEMLQENEEKPQTNEVATDDISSSKYEAEESLSDQGKTVDEKEEASREEKQSLQAPGDLPQPKGEKPVTQAPLVAGNTTSAVHEFTCGRCLELISLESEFFRCVGHACQNYYVCLKCSSERYEADDSDHQWWHTLFCLRKEFIIGGFTSQLPSTDVVGTNKVETPNESNGSEDNEWMALSDTVHARISKMEEKMVILTSTLETRTERLEAIPKIEDKLDTINVSLEGKVERLEAKLDGVMMALQELLGGLALQNGKASV